MSAQYKTKDEIDKICKGLDEVRASGLEAEVIYSALIAMKEDKELSPSEAFDRGCDEWDI
jgi:hypothetical protein